MPSLPNSQPPRKHSKSLWQERLAQQRTEQKRFSRGGQRPRSHSLPMLVLTNVQQLNRRRQIWFVRREMAYAQKAVAQAQLELIRSADPTSVAVLKQRAELDRLQAEINHLNWHGPTDVAGAGGATLADSAIQHSVHVVLASISDQVMSPELAFSEEQQQQVELAFAMTDMPWPPCATVRSTPRRPGAPSFALRLNH